MSIILPEKTILTQQRQPLKGGCHRCGSIKLKRNGTYTRKTHVGNSQILYPVTIQRIMCLCCNHTFSLLPEWLPPYRWYVWEVQEKTLLALLLSTSIRMISKQYKMARSTLRRWFSRLKDQFDIHADQLKQLLPNVLGRRSDFISFWKSCLSQCSLAQAMGYLHNAGIEIP